MFVVQKILKLKIWQFVSGFAKSAKPATIEIEIAAIQDITQRIDRAYKFFGEI